MVGRRIALTVVGVLFAAGCGDDGGDGDGEVRRAPQNPWLALLEQIPDTADGRSYILLNDYVAAREAAGVEQPDPDDGEDELLEYWEELNAGEGDLVAAVPAELTGGPGRFDGTEEDFRDEIGFAFSDLDRDAVAGNRPDTLQVLEGRIDGDAVEEAVESDDVWSDHLERESHTGVEYYTWGDEVERATPARPLGRGGRLLVDGSTAVFTATTDTMEAAIDARAGDEPTIADREEFADLAAAMDELGVYSVFMSDEPITGEPRVVLEEDPDAAAEEFEEFALRPYEAYAIGGGLDDAGPYIAVALVHDEEDAAAENVERLERIVEEGEQSATGASGEPWRDLLEVEEITSDGTLLRARLRLVEPDMAALWFQIVLERQNLIASA